LDGDATCLRLSITDNGIGFDAARPVEPTHRGLLNMAERARSIGSRLELRSEPGKGTCVCVEVPLPTGGEA
jgi:signal transduction histidine kinase